MNFEQNSSTKYIDILVVKCSWENWIFELHHIWSQGYLVYLTVRVLTLCEVYYSVEQWYILYKIWLFQILFQYLQIWDEKFCLFLFTRSQISIEYIKISILNYFRPKQIFETCFSSLKTPTSMYSMTNSTKILENSDFIYTRDPQNGRGRKRAWWRDTKLATSLIMFARVLTTIFRWVYLITIPIQRISTFPLTMQSSPQI